MEEVWYRPKGSQSTDGRRYTMYDIWYRRGPNDRPQTTSNGRRDWTNPLPSYEFPTMEAMLASGTCIRVAAVGKTTPWDPDFDVDEGL